MFKSTIKHEILKLWFPPFDDLLTLPAMMRCLLIAIVLFLSLRVFSQGQNNFWYFGFNAGLDFNETPVQSVKGAMSATEGCASVADPDGNLLFYTDGRSVWNRKHNLMPHGTGLMGGSSSAQAATIVPFPKSISKYYLFTTEDASTGGGLSYSIIDMALDNGYGDIAVSAQNILLKDGTSEKLASVLHLDGESIWVVAHELNTDRFLTYLITSLGITDIPVVSSLGPAESSIGMLKPSHSGLKIVNGNTYSSALGLYDFDRTTGMLSGYTDLSMHLSDTLTVYGVEFSPNDSLLYLSGWRGNNSDLYQYDLKNNEVFLLQSRNGTEYSALQLAPDKQVYLARFGADYLGVVHKPNEFGLNADFEEKGILLQPGTMSASGLPAYVQYAFHVDSVLFFSLGADTAICNGNPFILNPQHLSGCDTLSYLWNDGSDKDFLEITGSGTYWLEIRGSCGSYRDSIHISFLDCLPVIHYSLDACESVMANGSHMDYSEFVPVFPSVLPCAEITADYLFRISPEMNKHSCTPGINGSPGMCISVPGSCNYQPGSSASIIIDFEVAPEADSAFQFTGLEFYEKGPLNYDWINGPSGPNNYPQYYGIRILKNGIEIYKKEGVTTSTTWNLEQYDFAGDTLFRAVETSTFQIELLPYCPVGSGATVAAWDIDEITIYGACIPGLSSAPVVFGSVHDPYGQPLGGIEMKLSAFPEGEFNLHASCDGFGSYAFDDLGQDHVYTVSGYYNGDLLNGVSTLDIIRLQKHLLGISPLHSVCQFIAADVNHSGTITVLDLLEMRKAILGKTAAFPNNTSWRFGALPLDIEDNTISGFKDEGIIETIGKDSIQLDFVGVKIGDVNGDALPPNPLQVISKRSAPSVSLVLQEKKLMAGHTYSIPVRMSNSLKMAGLQFSMKMDNVICSGIQGNSLPIREENYSIVDGELRLSWNADSTMDVSPESPLFTIELEPVFSANVSRLVRGLDGHLKPEVYPEGGDVLELDYHFQPSDESDQMPAIEINPTIMSSESQIEFYQPMEGVTEFRFVDLSGRVLYHRVEEFPAGWNTTSVSKNQLTHCTGMIYCQLILNGSFRVGKMLVVE